MLVKTFQAGEMSEALRMVKAEMGLDAMILSSKKERKKGILGFFSKPYYEVTAALEPRPVQQRPNPYREEAPPVQERELSTREEFQNSMLGPLAREVRELKQRIEALSKKEAQQAVPQAQPSQEPQPESPAGPRTFAKEELEEIKQLLYNAVSGNKDKGPKPVTFQLAGQALEQTAVKVAAQPEPMAVPFPVEQLEQPNPASALKLVKGADRGSDEERLLEKLADELRGEEVGPMAVQALTESVRAAAEGGVSLDELRSLMAENLAGMVKCSGSLRIKKNGPRIVAVVGPTGVGKTTTIAKIAAMYALNRRVSVAMVTMDNFRVGAVEQLKTYAKIMDLPLEVAGNSQELSGALARHSDKDLILIDTAGRSPKDADRLDELKGYLETQTGIDVYLCLSATTRSREIDEIIATFGTLPVTKLLFTKLDESRTFGCIVDTCLKHKIPLSYFSTGQKVPEDIEVATSRKLAAMVVQESN
ncbi:flagellar biosynthesis protein FlhF [Geomonas nitrogeniifigens]|uniref:Flagellar biosynthesis protein FlhF n=1 Tax=Geomonas diazotrophica TaxID=2843197 RepID=A0ABX8JGE0_9BACT|nr:flagellar biosynthesis protein FlhF [Geomonas nitrogeniifigens]QWV97056.1 flagellar biosynthesis protein FlhF [Geomonas nitrogeniifigens]QXE86228.1 flagellar biosynthesis protein FlhF [Geomonas nitrogeniifigens]